MSRTNLSVKVLDFVQLGGDNSTELEGVRAGSAEDQQAMIRLSIPAAERMCVIGLRK